VDRTSVGKEERLENTEQVSRLHDVITIQSVVAEWR
jgi:hypothetical protein